MRGLRLHHWEGAKHRDHDELMELFNRVGQVWEDEDGWIYFIVGEPKVATYEMDGRPFQYEHAVLVIDSEGNSKDWPLFETNDRPLELTESIDRLG